MNADSYRHVININVIEHISADKLAFMHDDDVAVDIDLLHALPRACEHFEAVQFIVNIKITNKTINKRYAHTFRFARLRRYRAKEPYIANQCISFLLVL